MRFKHLGATMLAGAMALSMVLAPTTHALAYTADRATTQDTYRNKQGNYTNGVSSLINKNVVVVYKLTKAEIQKMQTENTAEYQKIVNEYGDPIANPYGLWDNSEFIGGVRYWIITKLVYENTVNGKTSDSLEEVTDGDIGIPSTLVINTKSWYNLGLSFNGGNVGIKNLKSSKKKVATVTLAGENKTIVSTNEPINRDSKKGKYYYTGAYGERVYVDGPNAIVNASEGTATVRIYAKKKGTSKLSFNIVNKDGKVTGKKTITIKVKDTTPFKELTYAGKNLIYDPVIGKEDKNYIYYGKNRDKDATGDLGSGYTTKAKGNLVVKMNDGYKLVKIEVGKLFQEKIASNLDLNSNKSQYAAGKKQFEKYTDEDQFNSYTGTISSNHYVDLNGDGDYLDVVNGVSETNVNYKYTTIRNKSKITLSKVTWGSKYSEKNYDDDAYIWQYKTDANGNRVLDENGDPVKEYRLVDPDKYTQRAGSSKYIVAPTAIRITYYDKDAKAYKVFEKDIYLKTGK